MRRYELLYENTWITSQRLVMSPFAHKLHTQIPTQNWYNQTWWNSSLLINHNIHTTEEKHHTTHAGILEGYTKQINGLVQDCSNSIADALELLQSCTKPLKSGVHANCSPVWPMGCSMQPRSIPWLLMPWLLVSPGHHQPWNRLCAK